MALSTYFPKFDINEFCKNVINGKTNINEYNQQIEENPNWLEEVAYGVIDIDILSSLVNLCITNFALSEFLKDIIEYVDGEYITDDIFNKLCFFPKNSIRKAFLISLAHKDLTEKQLLFLCDTEYVFEPFFELSMRYYRECEYSLEVLQKFLKKFRNTKFATMYNDLVLELYESSDASNKEKKEYITSIIKNTKNTKNGGALILDSH